MTELLIRPSSSSWLYWLLEQLNVWAFDTSLIIFLIVLITGAIECLIFWYVPHHLLDCIDYWGNWMSNLLIRHSSSTWLYWLLEQVNDWAFDTSLIIFLIVLITGTIKCLSFWYVPHHLLDCIDYWGNWMSNLLIRHSSSTWLYWLLEQVNDWAFDTSLIIFLIVLITGTIKCLSFWYVPHHLLDCIDYWGNWMSNLLIRPSSSSWLYWLLGQLNV